MQTQGGRSDKLFRSNAQLLALLFGDYRLDAFAFLLSMREFVVSIPAQTLTICALKTTTP
jgi:hypothetical protein